jgi:hypothetical protein
MKTFGAIKALCFFLLIFSNANGQSSFIPKYEIGILGGAFIYQGDLTPNDFGAFNTMKPGFGIFASRTLNSALAFRLQLLRGKLKGDDSKYENPEWRQQRNFKFKSPVTEFSGLFIWNLLGLKPNEAGIINFTPYVFGGVGYSFLNIKRDWSQFNSSHFASEPAVLDGLIADADHKLPTGIFEFPVGIGVRYGINSKLSFTIEGTYRLTNTDYLDGFSQAANPDMNDHFHTMMVGLMYSFGKHNKFDCPKIRN